MATISAKELEKYPLVALVGRVNVGKSSLFNLLISQKKALTAQVAGTTRDLNYDFCDWRGVRFALADSGGYMAHPVTDIDKKVAKQVRAVLKKSKLVLFVVDVLVGLNPEDREFLKVIRASTKAPIMLIANKADNLKKIQETHTQDWLKLGLGEPYPVSAANGLGSGDLIDVIMEKLGATPAVEPVPTSTPLNVAIIGRTNVGKSSLLNRILGEERVIVSETAHTTREPHDTLIYYGDQAINLIDTVGIRRKSRVSMALEKEGVSRSIKAIEKADIVLLVIESQVTPSKQELRLARIAVDVGAGIVVVVNKLDLIEGKDTKSIKAFEAYYQSYFKFIKWAPMIFISALKGQRVTKIYDRIMEVADNRSREIPQDELTVFMKKAIAKQAPARIMNRRKPVVYGFQQASVSPPAFRLVVNDPFSINYMYLRYMENRLREQYNYDGTIIKIFTEEKGGRKTQPHLDKAREEAEMTRHKAEQALMETFE